MRCALSSVPPACVKLANRSSTNQADNDEGLRHHEPTPISQLQLQPNLFLRVFKTIDRREQVADVSGQEIMTRDKVTLRVNLLVTYQVTDPQKAVTVVNDHTQALYREAQLALRAAIGTQTLDATATPTVPRV